MMADAVRRLTLADANNATGDILFWLGVTAAVGTVLAIAGAVLYRRVRRGAQDSAPAAGFTLLDLKAMRQRGAITDAEYDRARAALLARTRAEVSVAEADGDPGPVGEGPADNGEPPPGPPPPPTTSENR